MISISKMDDFDFSNSAANGETAKRRICEFFGWHLGCLGWLFHVVSANIYIYNYIYIYSTYHIYNMYVSCV